MLNITIILMRNARNLSRYPMDGSFVSNLIYATTKILLKH